MQLPSKAGEAPVKAPHSSFSHLICFSNSLIPDYMAVPHQGWPLAQAARPLASGEGVTEPMGALRALALTPPCSGLGAPWS